MAQGAPGRGKGIMSVESFAARWQSQHELGGQCADVRFSSSLSENGRSGFDDAYTQRFMIGTKICGDDDHAGATVLQVSETLLSRLGSLSSAAAEETLYGCLLSFPLIDVDDRVSEWVSNEVVRAMKT
ncbi:hypothetical protein KC317_g38 [Hortaea werneckii]|nr:hypothetical protein KC317_g38 [Hortaea werneckii]